MSSYDHVPLSPFGEADCESEIELLRGDYGKYYFHKTRFSEAAMLPDRYLFIGRRGSGKTALATYFSFQKKLKGALAIDVDEPAVFQKILNRLAETAAQTREVAIPRLVKIWELAIWSIVFRELQDEDDRIKAGCIFGTERGKVSLFIRHLMDALLSKFLGQGGELADDLESMLGDSRIETAKSAALEFAKSTPIIVAFDTLENYAVNDESMMRATAALVQAASNFNRRNASKNLHVKLFVMAEIFPRLKEEHILNPLKSVRGEVYLHWRPKELLRLICWRFHQHLTRTGQWTRHSVSINWNDHKDVREKMWEPYFGREISNGYGLKERTFPYVLRHTQMRPRQLIFLCNAIAARALASGTFPVFSRDDIIEGVRETELDLSDEVINAYSSSYPNIGSIIEALSGIDMIFRGSELDKRAPETASEWRGQYTPLRFRQLVAELGIVGRVREDRAESGYVEADFEYNERKKVPLPVTEQCVVHPMFYEKLDVNRNRDIRLYPFPDHADFSELVYT